MRLTILFAALCSLLQGADLAGSQDPPGMKRYAGSEIIGYRAPKFDELVIPLGKPTQLHPAAYAKSLKVEGRLSRCTYLVPEGRTPVEVYRNYKLELKRLGAEVLFDKSASVPGWFGPTFDSLSDEDGLGQILGYNEANEHVLAAKTRDAYYYVFVTAYADGVIPHRLEGVVNKNQVLAEVIVVQPEAMETQMKFVNAEEMKSSIHDDGKVILYGLFFDTDKDAMRADSQPTVDEIVKLLHDQPALKLRIVGHTDNQGAADHNLDLSFRRARNIVRTLVERFAIEPARLDAFGCGMYAPVASNDAEAGRARNRRVELVKW